jgi:hypothetical protein
MYRSATKGCISVTVSLQLKQRSAAGGWLKGPLQTYKESYQQYVAHEGRSTQAKTKRAEPYCCTHTGLHAVLQL